ncbi:MAG: polysaccharide deacetylase family protein [Egibacteraceae bacterium]
MKRALARAASRRPAAGLSVLIYHRVGGGTPDEMDVPVMQFRRHLEVLRRHRPVSLDAALDELEAGDNSPKAVLTFDDGFADVHDTVLPLLVEFGMPFTLYLATGYVGGVMRWPGPAATPGPGLRWEQLEALLASGLCTFANHTHTHPLPARLTVDDVDRCTDAIRARLGVVPRHFAYPFGVPVPALDADLRTRFRSAATGLPGRGRPGGDLLRLPRIPVRQTDPIGFFAAKLTGRLLPERLYGGAVSVAKRAGVRA